MTRCVFFLFDKCHLLELPPQPRLRIGSRQIEGLGWDPQTWFFCS